MIVRVFRARVVPELRAEFETELRRFAVPFVRSHAGLVSVTIGRPTQRQPDEFVMVSVWEDVDALIGMAGPEWDQAHIADDMAKYIEECWVHHYEAYD